MAEEQTSEQTTREMLEQLAARLEHLERVMQAQTARLYAIELRVGFERAGAPPALRVARGRARRGAPRRPRRRPAPRPPTRGRGGTSAAPRNRPPSRLRVRAGAGQHARTGAKPSAAAAAAKPRDLESLIGGSIFSWAGILAAVFAVAFALKYAFDKDWISPTVRVALGALGGRGCSSWASACAARACRPYAYVLSGGGVLILYLSVYAAYDFYQLLAQPVAFLLMTAVTAVAVLLSVRLNALPVAVLGLGGRFPDAGAALDGSGQSGRALHLRLSARRGRARRRLLQALARARLPLVRRDHV